MPMATKLNVIALEIPARDQPVAVAIGSRKIASENMAPMLTQVISAPMATRTQRYGNVICEFHFPGWPLTFVSERAGRAMALRLARREKLRSDETGFPDSAADDRNSL